MIILFIQHVVISYIPLYVRDLSTGFSPVLKSRTCDDAVRTSIPYFNALETCENSRRLRSSAQAQRACLRSTAAVAGAARPRRAALARKRATATAADRDGSSELPPRVACATKPWNRAVVCMQLPGPSQRPAETGAKDGAIRRWRRARAVAIPRWQTGHRPGINPRPPRDLPYAVVAVVRSLCGQAARAAAGPHPVAHRTRAPSRATLASGERRSRAARGRGAARRRAPRVCMCVCVSVRMYVCV